MNSVRRPLMRIWFRRQKNSSMFLLQFCLPKPRWNHTTCRICHSEVGALRVSVAVDFHLVIAKLTRKRRRQNRYRLSLWITGSLGNLRTEHMTHSSSAHRARSQEQRHLESPSAVEGCDAPVSCKFSDGRSGLHGVQESHPQVRSGAQHCCPPVTLSRMVGTAKVCLKHLPGGRARATERSNVLFNLCTNLRGPSKTSGATLWNHVGVSKSALGLVG